MTDTTLCFRIQAIGRSQLLQQRRHDLRIGRMPRYVDKDRKDLNVTLYQLPEFGYTANIRKTMDREEKEILKRAAHKTKVGRYWRMAILTFSHAAQQLLREKSELPHSEALEAAQDFAVRHKVKLISLDYHGDEAAPHYHITFDGIDNLGYAIRLNSKALSDEQDFFARHFSIWGIGRGKPKAQRIDNGEPWSAIIHRSVAQLHSDLPAEIAAIKLQRDEQAKKLQINVNRANEAFKKAAEGTERAEKAAKNALAYERRIQDAKAKVAEYERQLVSRELLLNHEKDALLEREKAQLAMLSKREQALEDLKKSLDLREAETLPMLSVLSGVETHDRYMQRHAIHAELKENTIEQELEMNGWRTTAAGYLVILKDMIGQWWANFGKTNDFDFR